MKAWMMAIWLISTAAAAAIADGAPAEGLELEAGASAAVDAEHDAAERKAAQLANFVPVESIPALGRMHSWAVVDDDKLILWSARSRPYLVELFRPSPELRFATSIGVTSFGSRIHARFDSVEVDGFSYPIRRIYQLSRNEAEALQATS